MIGHVIAHGIAKFFLRVSPYNYQKLGFATTGRRVSKRKIRRNLGRARPRLRAMLIRHKTILDNSIQG